MRLLLPLCLRLFASPPEPRTRSFHFEYGFSFDRYDPTKPSPEVWIPLPHTDEYQTIRNLKIESYPYEVTTSPDGNVMAHVSLRGATANIPGRTVSFDAIREEHLQSRLTSGQRQEREEDPKILAKYLNPDRLVPIDGKIRQWAKEVVD